MKYLVLLILSLYSVSTFATSTALRARYTVLKNQLAKTPKASAQAMLPAVTKLYKDTVNERNAMKRQLDSEIELYKKTFTWLERHNPGHAASSECKRTKIDPKEKEYKALEALVVETNLLIDDTKIKAGLMQPRNQSSPELDFNNSIGPTMGAAAGSSGF